MMKWIFTETYSQKKVILCYEKLLTDFCCEFSKLLDYFGTRKYQERMRRIQKSTTKEEIKAMVDRKDGRVINVTKEYGVEKQEFVKTYGRIIMERLPSQISEVLRRDALELGKNSH
jgi:hypothetical protein